jgi:hypothetical protein
LVITRSPPCLCSICRRRPRPPHRPHRPRLSTPLLWEALVDTAEPTGLAKDGRLWKPGESYPLRGHSFALFINRAPADAPIATVQAVVELDCTGPKAEDNAPPS